MTLRGAQAAPQKKNDNVNMPCIAHQIIQCEQPPKDRFIVLKYINNELEIMTSVAIEVTPDKFDLVGQGAIYAGVCFELKPAKNHYVSTSIPLMTSQIRSKLRVITHKIRGRFLLCYKITYILTTACV